MVRSLFRSCVAATLVALIAGAVHGQSTTTWQGTTSGSWNDPLRWSSGLPTINLDALIDASIAQTITNSGGSTDAARSLSFSGANHALSGGNLWLQSGSISVASTRTGTISSSLSGTAGLIKTGAGTLTLNSNTNLITGGISINAGSISVPSTARLALGNNAINLNGGTLDLGYNAGTVWLREFGGSSAVSADIMELHISSLNDTTYSSSGAIGSNGQGVGLQKTGPGTLSVTGGIVYERTARDSNIWRGGVTFGGASGRFIGGWTSADGAFLYGGTLTLDDSTVDIDRYGDTLPMRLYGGNSRLRYLGQASTASAETIGAFGQVGDATGNVGPRYAAIDVRPGSSGTASLTFASIAAQTQSANISLLNFTTGGGNAFGTDARLLIASAPTLRNSVLPGGIVNGVDIATYVAGKGVMAFGSAGSGVSYTNPTNVNDPASTNTVLINATTTTTTLTANRRYNALKIDGAQTINLGNFTLSVGSSADATNYMSGLFLKTGAGQAEIISSSTTTAGLWNTGGSDVVNNFSFYVNEGSLRVTAPFRTSGNGAVRVQKAGAGVLLLDPVAAYQGQSGQAANAQGIYFSEGVIRMNPSLGGVGTSSQFANYRMRLDGGVMEITGGIAYNPTIGTAAANLDWISNGGFAAFGANATFQPNIAWGAASHIPNGAALLLNSTTADKTITFSGTLNLGTSATQMYLREIFVDDNTGSSTDFADISGPIIADTTATGGGTPTISYHLVKNGPGTLRLTNANNTYSGASYVRAGTLLVNGALATPASLEVARNPEYTAVNVMNAGTLGGIGTINRVVRVENGGFLSPGDSTAATTTGILTIGADASLVTGATLRMQINGDTAGTLYDQLRLASGNLDISSSTLDIQWGSFSTTTLTNIWIVNNTGNGTMTGMFANLANDAMVGTVNGTEWKIRYNVAFTETPTAPANFTTGNDIVLYAIPEPSGLVLVGCGLIGVAVHVRSRRKNKK